MKTIAAILTAAALFFGAATESQASFSVFSLFAFSRAHKSDEYEDAPMPFAVFFSGGYAVHATEFTKRLGTPASHGCVRLSLENAQTFFNLVKTYGMTNTKIVITE